MGITKKAISLGTTAALIASLAATIAAPAAFAAASLSPISGPVAGGTTVTVSGGTGYTVGTTLTLTAGLCVLNATPTSVTPDGTSLTFVTPAATGVGCGAGAYAVATVSPAGAVGTFTYLNPAPTITVSPNAGPTAGSTSITITGSGTAFTGTPTVTIGGIAATSVVLVSTTSITAVTPANTVGAKSLVVSGLTNTYDATTTYTYTTTNPTVTSVTPSSGSAAGGTVVTIAGTGFVAGATVTFGGSAATLVGFVNSTTLTATTPAHAAGAVSVAVTNPDLGSGTLANAYTYVAASAPGLGSGASAVTTTGFGNVARGAVSSAGTFTITEGAVNNFVDGTVTVTAYDAAGAAIPFCGSASSAGGCAAPTATVTAGIGSISASVPAAGGSLTISISGTTSTRLDNFAVSGLKLNVPTSAALGAVSFRYTTTGPNFGAINATASGTLNAASGTGTQTVAYTLNAGSPDFQVTNTSVTPAVGLATFSGGASESVALVAPTGGGTLTATFSVNHPANTATTPSAVTQTVAVSWFPSTAAVVDSAFISAVSAPSLQNGLNNQSAGNLAVTLGNAGFVPAGATLTFTIATPGVLFSSVPAVSDNDPAFALGAGYLSFDRTSVTYPVTVAATNDQSTLTLSSIHYDVAQSVAAGTAVNVNLAISGGVLVSGNPANNAVVAYALVGSGAVPTIYIGFNDQPTGLLTFRETVPGTLTDIASGIDTFGFCLTSNETFARVPWAVVTAGDLKLNVGGLAASQATMIVSGSCAWVEIYSASTVASTVEIRAGADAASTAPVASSPTAGVTVNVPSSLGPGATTVQAFTSQSDGVTSRTNLGPAVVIAMRAYKGSPVVAVVPPVPVLNRGAQNAPGADITITESLASQFTANETINLCIVNRALVYDQDVAFANTAGANMPTVTTNNGATGLVASIAYNSGASCNTGFWTTYGAFQITVNAPAVGALGMITVHNIQYNVVADAQLGPVFLFVQSSASGASAIKQVVSPATIGVPATLQKVVISAFGSGGTTYSISSQVLARGQKLTVTFKTSPKLAGEKLGIWLEVRQRGATSFGPFSPHTSIILDYKGVGTYTYVASSGVKIGLSGRFLGNATLMPATSYPTIFGLFQ